MLFAPFGRVGKFIPAFDAIFFASVFAMKIPFVSGIIYSHDKKRASGSLSALPFRQLIANLATGGMIKLAGCAF